MKKVIRLTESDLTRIVKRTIMEMEGNKSLFDIKSIDCDKFDNVSREGHVDLDDDTIVIRYCKGDERNLEYLKEKGMRLLQNQFNLPDEYEDGTFGY